MVTKTDNSIERIVKSERLVVLAHGGVVAEGVYRLAMALEERGLTVVGVEGRHVHVWPQSRLTADLAEALQARGRELWAYLIEHCTRVSVNLNATAAPGDRHAAGQ